MSARMMILKALHALPHHGQYLASEFDVLDLSKTAYTQGLSANIRMGFIAKHVPTNGDPHAYRYTITPLGVDLVEHRVVWENMGWKGSTIRPTWLAQFPYGVSINPPTVLL